MINIYLKDRGGGEQKCWENNWSSTNVEELSTKGIHNFEELPIILKYLKKNDRILDSGCGLGQFVYHLEELGYNIHGMDFSYDLIKRAKLFGRDKKYFVGDINYYPVKSDSYDAVLSFGIIEHLELGQTQTLRETYRILKKGGLLFIDVPYLNLINKIGYPYLKIKEVLCRSHKYKFYQSVFSRNSIVGILQDAGFRIILTKRMYPFTLFIRNKLLNSLRIKLIRFLRGTGRQAFCKSTVVNLDSVYSIKDGSVSKKFVKKILSRITPHFIFFVCVKE